MLMGCAFYEFPSFSRYNFNFTVSDLSLSLSHTHTQDIYLENPNVTWDDIIGLEAPKRLVKEAVVYPIKVGTEWWHQLSVFAVFT